MHEGQWLKITASLDPLQDKHFPLAGSNVEFHASDLRSGRKLYRDMDFPARNALMREIYNTIVSSRVTLFAATIQKSAHRAKYPGVDPYETAFEGLCTMFNYFLRRVQTQTGNVVRGIVVFDESRPSLSKQLRTLLARFQASGTRWAKMTNLIETAFFFDSRNSRLMQVADFTSYAVYRWYEAGDDSYIRIINRKFDRERHKMHGLRCYPLECTRALP